VWFPWLAAVTAASHLDLLSVKKRFNLLLILLTIAFSSKTQAVSFTADAVQLRGSDVSHARMYWSDGNVRFEYLDQGVPMVQIFDTRNRKITWLDTEKKLYVQRDMNQEQMRLGTEQQPTSENPCDNFPGAECTHLKTVELKGRQAEKWLITMDVSGRDMHIFQWLDKQYKIPLRQENPDGTVLDVKLLDNQEFNGRKARLESDLIEMMSGLVSQPAPIMEPFDLLTKRYHIQPKDHSRRTWRSGHFTDL